MSKFYDQLMVFAKREKIKENLKDAIVISVDNIAQYYVDNYIGKKVLDLEKDIPNLAPPFNKFFIEYKYPDYSKHFIGKKSEKDRTFLNIFNAMRGHRVGALFTVVTPPQKKGELYYELKLNLKWLVYCELYSTNDYLPQWIHKLAINKDGKLINIGNYIESLEKLGVNNSLFFDFDDYKTLVRANKDKPYIYASGISHHMRYPNWSEHLFDSTDEIMGNVFYPMYLSLGFLHCKNIILKEITPPIKLSKKYLKKHDRSLVKYHVLQIKPMKKIFKTEEQVDKSGFKKALHICRGHFKNFDNKPLFGKITGTFWWAAYVRGQKEKGIILKDYEIDKPKKES